MMADSQVPLVHLPLLVRFAIVLAIFLLIPPLCRRLRMPPGVGLLLAGVALGPSGLGTLPNAAPVAKFFAEIGVLLLMFFAGLEIDLSQFRRTGARSLGFGFLTFSMPLVVGAGVAMLAGYGWLAAVLIGSLMASHTLIGFPIVQRMKLVTDEAVAVTIGGTVFTDLSSLLVLAICLPIHTSGFSVSVFALQIAELVVYVLVVFLGLRAITPWLMEKSRDSKESQVTLVLLIIALAGFGAEAINLEPIIGAFLAGLAINRALDHSEAKEQLEFLGHTLFIPTFFVSIGFLIDVELFLQTLGDHTGLVVGIVGGLIVAKFLAARLTQRVIGYSRTQGRLIWSLSLPQVAATLAATLVAFQTRDPDGVRLIDRPVINTVLVLVVVTSILGPMLTEYFGRQRLAEQEAAAQVAVIPPPAASLAVGEVIAPDPIGLIKVSPDQAEQGAPAEPPTTNLAVGEVSASDPIGLIKVSPNQAEQGAPADRPGD
jgi:Kef-type K+ transport system membrane component KefB